MESILLLHGWNDDNYTSRTESKDAWDNRKAFVEELEKKYKVYKLNFPGFCGEAEPNTPWYLKDYADYVFNYIKKNKINVDYILGYSFGGAVAVMYNCYKNPNQKIILVSPAIARNNVIPKEDKCPSILKPLRTWYLKNIIKNPYIIHGTKFLNETYQNIVRVELIKEVNMINPSLLTIIYGSEDNMVNPSYVINNLDDKHKECVNMITGGSHDIANTHTDELIKIICEKNI